MTNKKLYPKAVPLTGYTPPSTSPISPPISTEQKMFKKYTPYIQLASSTLELINQVPEKRNFFHYFELACKIKLIYDDFKKNLSVISAKEFNKIYNNLKPVSGYDLTDEIICLTLLKNDQFKNVNVLNYEEAELRFYNFKDIRFVVKIHNDKLSGVYLEKESLKDRDKIYKFISQEIWKEYSTHVLTYNKEQSKFIEDLIENDFVENQKAIDFAQDLEIYLKDNINRSILFYGPPGSGKTNFMKNIARYLNLKTLKLSLKDLSDDFVVVLISIFKPDVVIIDDLDHTPDYDQDAVLSNIQEINSMVKLLLASANVISSLNPSLQRPGRFDELVKIDKLDEITHRNLVEQDEELYQLTKDFPVVYIVEIMKRVKYKGKEYALKNSQDVVSRVQNLNSFNYEVNLKEET